MRLFLYEYTTAGGASQGDAASLATEGWAMLASLAEDFGNVPGIHTTTLMHERHERNLGHRCVRLGNSSEENVFKKLASEVDFTLAIAPEFDDLLAERCRWVADVGGQWLGSSLEAIVLAGDKLSLARHFHERGIPSPPTIPLSISEGGMSSRVPEIFPAVCKPRHGAGSRATYLVHDAAGFQTACRLAQQEMSGTELVVQPYVPGRDVSVCFFMGRSGLLPLLPVTQKLSNDSRRSYLGGQGPLHETLAKRSLHLARRAIMSVPGLAGPVGVDLVLGESAGGSDDWVIEINPRFTTSYVGLRRMTQTNLAEKLLSVYQGSSLPGIDWQQGRMTFYPDGRTVFSELS